jgi:hypothetical protein
MRVLLRHIQRRIPVEEPRRHEFEPRGRDRHDRPFLRTRVMGHSHRVPDDHVLPDKRLVVRQPLREPIAHRVLVRVRPAAFASSSRWRVTETWWSMNRARLRVAASGGM